MMAGSEQAGLPPDGMGNDGCTQLYVQSCVPYKRNDILLNYTSPWAGSSRRCFFVQFSFIRVIMALHDTR